MRVNPVTLKHHNKNQNEKITKIVALIQKNTKLFFFK